MKFELMKNNGDVLTSNDVLNLCPENEQEQIFLQKFANLIRQDMMDELTKQVEKIAYFNNVNVNLKTEDNILHNHNANTELIKRRLGE